MLMKEIMESELNKKIRELLELFEINPDIVVGEWNLIGHLKQFIESLLSKQKEEYSSDGRCIVCNYKKMLGIT